MAEPMSESTATVDTTRWSIGRGTPSLAVSAAESVVTEEPLEIRLVYGDRAETVSVTMRTPDDDEDLALGFLFTEGILSSPEEVERLRSHRSEGDHILDVITRGPIRVDPDLRRQFLTSSSCGVCGRSLVKGLYAARGGPIRSDLRVAAGRLGGLPDRLRKSQTVFDRTGGLHAAGLFDREGSLLASAEDVGRHNAVDKVVGRRFRDRKLPDDRAMLQVSGRVSFEIVQKAAAAGIPIVSAVSAPSSLAVSAADRLGLTLAAFVRGDRLTLYAHPERVVENDDVEPSIGSPGA
jgi:FdhD protein